MDDRVYFDGSCGVCRGFAGFVQRHDRSGRFRFESRPEETSLVYRRGGRLFRRSEAVWRILSDMGGVWRLLAAVRCLPVGFRDRCYDLVAKRRHGRCRS